MSHTGGGGGHGHHGHHGGQGGHPDQSAGWNSALQGGNKPITSLPNPTLWPIVFALGVFVLMLLPFCINWGDGGVELPWANKHAQAPADGAAMAQNDVYQQQSNEAQSQEQLQSQTQDLSAPVAAQNTAAAPAAPVSYQQQLMYASQQAYSPAGQSAAQSGSGTSYAQQGQGQAMGQGQAQYNQYATQNYSQSQPAYQAPPQRHRVWADR